jgi:hypothetical protein
VPVTAKLSRQFYEKLGDEVANELVNWFNAVDESYRSEFRDLFEANFARLEARLAQQTAELHGEIGRLRSDFELLRAELTVRLQRHETRLIRWMFGFWIGSWLTLVGTLLALRQF